MANESKANATPRRPRRWLRWLGILFAAFLLLLVVGYFVGTSSWFLKKVILPKASTAMNANITVDDANISPFSSVILRGLKVETKGPDPLVTAQEVRARYSLMDIIRGNINVQEVMLDAPVVTLVTFPDGTSNLDPLTKEKEKKEHEKEPKEKKKEEPAQLNLEKFALKNAIVRKITQRPDGTKEVVELSGVNVTADQLGNNKTGKLGLAANVRMDQGLNSASNGVLAASVAGNFDVALDQELKPKTLKGQTKVDVADAKGAYAQAAGLGVLLNADLTPTQLNDVSVRFGQRGTNLGALTVSGPFSADTMEGDLAIALTGIDRKLLGIVGAASGVDFNQTAISSTNAVQLTQRGRIVKVNGQLLVDKMSLTQQGQTTPVLDVRSVYGLEYDQTNKTALVQTFNLTGNQQGSEFLRGALTKPMLLNLGSTSNAVDESAFDLVVTNFNLPDWRAFAGTNVTLTSGRLAMNLRLLSQQAGKNLALNLVTRLTDLTASSGSNRIDNADLSFDARGTVRDFTAVAIEQYRAVLGRDGQQALQASGALAYNTKSQDADVQANLETALPEVTRLVAMPGMNLSAGTVKFAGRIVQKNTTPQQTNNPVLDRTVAGKLNVDNLTGTVASNRFDRFATAVDLDIAMNGPAVDIRKMAGTIQQSGQAGGSFDVAGKYHLENKAGQVTARLVDLNQHALKSFMAAALGEKQLESINVNANTTAKLDGPDSMAVKAELKVANLVVNDPSGAVPRTPLAVDLNADVTKAKEVIDLKQVQLALTKTERAPNSLNVAGRVDMTKSNAWTGNLKVTSDGLDVTPYYEIFAKNTNAAQTAQAPAAKPGAGTGEAKPETEPEPMKLPFSQFTQETSIARFFLREVAISNLQSKTVIDNGRVTLKPFSLSLNGAPVTMTVLANVSVPGYQYDLTAKMDRVPLEPLVNTFAPERRGQVKGDLLMNAQVKGAGTTGKSLQKNLAANAGFTITNANIQVTQNTKVQNVLGPIAKILRIPQIAESPLTWVDGRAAVSNGTVLFENVIVESSVLKASLAGTATLAEVMDNSTLNNLPLNLAVRRNIADAARITPRNTPADAQYVALPQFVSVGGTFGDPKARIDQLAVAKVLAGELDRYIPEDAQRILRGIGNLGGGSSTNKAAAGTNAAPSPSTGGLLEGLGGLLQKKSGKDAAPANTNAPAATNTAPATNTGGGLLQGLGGLLQRPANTNTATNAPTTNAPAKQRPALDLNRLFER